MTDDRTESLVRQHLRDRPGEAQCARCLARVLNLKLRATDVVVAALAERRPPFAVGRCDCGNYGLKFLSR